MQDEVRALWAVLLKVAPPPPHAGFFELGGNVLAAHLMLRRLSRTYGIDLRLRQIYETPTLEALAGAIARRIA
ncbi:phosphopantetheine-binding protein [Streptomyces antimicrobicus]|uniref:Phosphopantetheine-binding protein n=1 Tax=Streptomyces antimicrobicus TaxID=2883108 RepID=A0ABS8B1P1_9ACTN|nr:phosphopantetheine-binding protein [Streptomyces antimicrobicus]MCB5178527.1 phosphopantetheine-binding protein [Streptomyces antimicrobicus]